MSDGLFQPVSDRRWMPRQLAFVESLRGEKCPGCDKPKHPAKSFCLKCYVGLPANIRGDLYKRVGAGYEEAHDAAMKKLGKEPISAAT